jgi:hypothetical protein
VQTRLVVGRPDSYDAISESSCFVIAQHQRKADFIFRVPIRLFPSGFDFLSGVGWRTVNPSDFVLTKMSLPSRRVQEDCLN